ncbi:MAG: hypothetical protein MJ131_12105 [Lachnospiraceae bacterium]|nr:hypothetical protein [Lachnospiraceae bacterium]
MELDKRCIKSQEEAQAKFAKEQMKAISVFRSMSNGDVVPSADESKLMEYDPKLYQVAQAQSSSIIEIDSAGIDFSTFQTMNLGGGVTGAYIDLSC